MNTTFKGAFVAAAAATLFAAGAAQADHHEGENDAKVKCKGIHSCKGESACGVPGGHGCAGHNDCKGKGWIKVSEKECKEKGGEVL